MLKDRVVIGLAVGILADAVKLAFNYLCFKLNFTDAVFWQIVAGTVLSRADIFSPLGLLVGALADIVVTSLLGSVFIYLIYLTGKESLYLKGIGFGMFVWINFFVIVQGLLVQGKIPPTPTGLLVTFAAHFIFGLALAFFTQLLTANFGEEKEQESQSKHTFSIKKSLPARVRFKKAVKPEKLR
ncbi:MAG: hypothetical protein GX357_01225 [Firmicutes bacterium]|nr:hypothetical protein [Bacillota bacterium]